MRVRDATRNAVHYMKWDSEYGIWFLVDNKLITVHGTTFRNSDYMTLNIDLNPIDYGIELFWGAHKGIHLWPPDGIHTLEWKPKKCKCFGCMMRRPMSAEALQTLAKIFKEKRLYSDTEDDED